MPAKTRQKPEAAGCGGVQKQGGHESQIEAASERLSGRRGDNLGPNFSSHGAQKKEHWLSMLGETSRD